MPGPGGYEGSEHQEGLNEAEKRGRDFAAGESAADKILNMAKVGVVKMPDGKEYPLPEEKKTELRANLLRLLGEGIQRFDVNAKAGLDQAEWTNLHDEINREAARWLREAQSAEAEKLKQSIDGLSMDNLTAATNEISAFIEQNPNYLRGSSDWVKINAGLGKILGVTLDPTNEREGALVFGQKIQSLIRDASKQDIGSDGKLGVLSMNALALAVGSLERMRFVTTEEKQRSTYDVSKIVQRSEKGTTGAQIDAAEAVKTEIPAFAGMTSALPEAARPDLAKEAKPGFARRLEETPAQQILDQFSGQQKIEMITAAMEQAKEAERLTPEQSTHLEQIAMLKQALQSVNDDVDSSRTWTEWFRQAATENEETTANRKQNIQGLLNQLDTIAEHIQKDPKAKLNDLFSPALRDAFKEYGITDHTQIVSELVRATSVTHLAKKPELEFSVTGLLDESGNIIPASSPQELQKQYVHLLNYLREQKDYESARQLVEGKLLSEHFAEARKDLEITVIANESGDMTSIADQMRDKAYEKINKMITAQVLQQWRKGDPENGVPGMTEDQIEQYKKALIGDTADKLMNEFIREKNNGRPFDLTDPNQRQIMETYRDMTGAGDWNISDATWDTIIEEVMINAPLIVLSGGAASLVRAGVSAGARALIATGRLARFGLAVAQTGEKVVAAGRLGRTLLRAGQVGGLLVEGAAFESAHSLFKGDMSLYKDLPTWAQRVAISSATLGAFKFTGGQAAKFEKFLGTIAPKISDTAVKKAILHLALTKQVEAGTMLAIGAIQHGAHNGNFEDWNVVDEIAHAYLTAGALHLAGTGSRPVIEVAGKKFAPVMERAIKSVNEGVSPERAARVRTVRSRAEAEGRAPEARAQEKTERKAADKEAAKAKRQAEQQRTKEQPPTQPKTDAEVVKEARQRQREVEVRQDYDRKTELRQDAEFKPETVKAQNGELAIGIDIGTNTKYKNNQDALVVDTQANAFASIDGIGGNAGGEVAAKILAENFKGGFERDMSFAEIAKAAHDAMQVNAELAHGGGATFVAGRIRGNVLELALAGDPKVVVTEGSTVAFRTIDQGTANIVTNALSKGSRSASPMRYEVGLKEGQLVIAASDGLWKFVTPERAAELTAGKTPQEVTQILREEVAREVRRQGTKGDNVNIIVYRMERVAEGTTRAEFDMKPYEEAIQMAETGRQNIGIYRGKAQIYLEGYLNNMREVVSNLERQEVRTPAETAQRDHFLEQAREQAKLLAERLYELNPAEYRSALVENLPQHQREMARELESRGIASTGEILNALGRPEVLDGLPGRSGPVEAYFLPVKGSGGTGMVREVFYRDTAGNIVVKLIKSPLDGRVLGTNMDATRMQESQSNISNEALRMREFARFAKHPNLAKTEVSKIVDAQGREHIVLEKAGDVEGWEFIHRAEALPKTESILFQTMDGLDYMHQKNLVHNDIKWENLMVDSVTGQAKIIDFGSLAPQTRTRSWRTPELVRPEHQQLNEAVQSQHDAIHAVISTPSIFENSPAGRQLYEKMNNDRHFDPAYDQLALLQMVKDVDAIHPNHKNESPVFAEMLQHAKEGAAAQTPQEVSAAYSRIRELRIQLMRRSAA